MLKNAAPQADANITHGAASIQQRVRREIAAVIGDAESAVSLDVSISGLGLDSIMTVELRGRLESGCGIRLPLALFFREPTGREIAQEITRIAGTVDQQPLPELSDLEVARMLEQILTQPGL
jgi:acyl carrier protein